MADSLLIAELDEDAELLGAMLKPELELEPDPESVPIEQALIPRAATAAIENSPTILRCVYFMSISLPRALNGPLGVPNHSARAVTRCSERSRQRIGSHPKLFLVAQEPRSVRE
ncbi:hypothetical protein GCM10009861_20080 [Neomicrococcus aestuarii]